MMTEEQVTLHRTGLTNFLCLLLSCLLFCCFIYVYCQHDVLNISFNIRNLCRVVEHLIEHFVASQPEFHLVVHALMNVKESLAIFLLGFFVCVSLNISGFFQKCFNFIANIFKNVLKSKDDLHMFHPSVPILLSIKDW